jgi:Ca-activated chloride channel homolog
MVHAAAAINPPATHIFRTTKEHTPMAEILNLICRWGRQPGPASGSPQVGYLLVEAKAGTPTSTVPLNLCLVLDRSGSMQGAKLTALKDATRRLVEMLSAEDVVSIVLFDDTVQVLVPAAPFDRAALLNKIDSISEQGGTAMSGGMRAGVAELRKHLGAERVSAMLLLTDGQTWGDEESCKTLAQELAKDGVTITALGLGSEWNEKLLDTLAETTGGLSDYIALPENIGLFFQRAVRAAKGTVAQDARLLLRLVKDVQPRAVHRASPTIANLGYQPIGENEVAVRIGNLEAGTGGSVVVELMLPARAAGSFRVAQAELHYTPIGASPQVIKQDVLLAFVDDASQATYDPQVMNLVEKVTAFKLQTRALSEAEAGNVQGATQRLRAAATRLLDLGELELAKEAEQQATQLEQGQTLSADDQKAMRYATRRLN